MKKAMMLVLALAVVASFGLAGCKKKGDEKKSGGDKGASGFNCDAFAKKTASCSSDIIDVMLKKFAAKMPPETLAKVKEKAKRKFSHERLVKKCEKEQAKAAKDPKEKEGYDKMAACLAKDSCKDYAACFNAATGK